MDGQTNGSFAYYGSIVLPKKTEVFKVKMFIPQFWDQVIASLFGSLGNSDKEINNPNLNVLDIYAVSSLSRGTTMSYVAKYLNENQKQYFQNRTTPFIIYSHSSIESFNPPTDEQVLYFDPTTKTFSVMSVQTYMTQYRNKVSGTPPQAGPSQEQARAERERANASAASSQPSQSNTPDQVWSQLQPYLYDYELQLNINKISGGKKLSLSPSMFNPAAFTNGSLNPEVWNLIAQLPLKELRVDKRVQFPEVGSQYYVQDGYPHPGIYEVPTSILQMKTLENLTIDQNDGVIFPDISGLPNLKELKIGGDWQAETHIYLLKKNVDIFMARAQRNNNLYFLTGQGPIHGMKIIGLKNPDDFYGMNSFMRKYGHNTFGMYQIVGQG